MARELITSWANYQTDTDRLLTITTSHLRLRRRSGHLKLDSRPRLEHINGWLDAKHAGDILRMAVRNASLLRHQHPLLQQLLTTYGHLAAARKRPARSPTCGQHDAVIDGKHGLIRFERDMPRSKLLIDEADELRPYLARSENWTEGGYASPIRSPAFDIRLPFRIAKARAADCFLCYNLVLIR